MTNARGTASFTPGLARRIAAVCLAVALALGIAISAIEQRGAQRRQEAAAASHAQLLADSVIAPSLTPADVARPVTGDRELSLRALVSNRVLTSGVVAVTVLRKDGTVVFSTNPAIVGKQFVDEQLKAVFAGASQSRVSEASSGKVYETFVPIHFKDGGPVAAAVEIAQDYAAMLSAASHPWQPLELGFAIALLLCLIGMPLAFRTPSPKAADHDWLPKAAQAYAGADTDAEKQAEGWLRQAQEQARQADAAYRTVSEQLKKADERLAEAKAGEQSAIDQARQAEERAKQNDQRVVSTEVALKAARERLGQLEERVKKAEASSVIHQECALEAGGSGPEAGTRLRALEEELRQAQEKLRETEAVKQSLIEQARHAEERSAQVEAEAKRALAEHARQMEERAKGDGAKAEELKQKTEELEQRLSESDSDRHRLEAELSRARYRLREVDGELQQAETARSSLAEELRQANGRPNVSEELRRLEERAAQAEERVAQAEALAAQAEEKARSADDRAAQAAAVSAPVPGAELEQLREQLREADERAQLSETAYQSVAEELKEIRKHPNRSEELALAQERARRAEETLGFMQTRLDEAQALARRLEEQLEQTEAKAVAAEAAERSGSELEEVLRATQERLAGSTERLLQMEERAHSAERELKRLQEEQEENEARMRRSKMEEALRALNGEEPSSDAGLAAAASAASDPLVAEDRRASAPFLAALSLDAKNSLSTIMGVALTLKHKSAAGEQQALIRQLNVHTRKLDHIVADLLDADRLARGAVPLNRRRTDIDALVRRVSQESGVDDDRHVEVRSDRVVVAVDPIRVEQMVGALLTNSTNRTRPGSTLYVVIHPADGGVVIAVEDEEPSSDAAMSPVVERFADMHGGWARVESRAGGGSSFRVFLPDPGAPVDDDPEIVVADVTEPTDLPAATPNA